MDSALVRPPSPTYTAITPVSRAPEKTEPATSTDLPAKDTVKPSQDLNASQRSAANGQTAPRPDGDEGRSALERFTPSVIRQTILDPESDDLVFVATDKDTGEVIRQIPSETLMRLRAYAETVEAQRSDPERDTVETTA